MTVFINDTVDFLMYPTIPNYFLTHLIGLFNF